VLRDPNLALKMGLEVLKPEKIKTLTEVSRYIFEISNLTPVMNMPTSATVRSP